MQIISVKTFPNGSVEVTTCDGPNSNTTSIAPDENLAAALTRISASMPAAGLEAFAPEHTAAVATQASVVRTPVKIAAYVAAKELQAQIDEAARAALPVPPTLIEQIIASPSELAKLKLALGM